MTIKIKEIFLIVNRFIVKDFIFQDIFQLVTISKDITRIAGIL